MRKRADGIQSDNTGRVSNIAEGRESRFVAGSWAFADWYGWAHFGGAAWGDGYSRYIDVAQRLWSGAVFYPEYNSVYPNRDSRNCARRDPWAWSSSTFPGSDEKIQAPGFARLWNSAGVLASEGRLDLGSLSLQPGFAITD